MSSVPVPNVSAIDRIDRWRQRTLSLLNETIRPSAIQDDRDHRFRRDVFVELAKQKIHCLAVDRKFGGGGEMHAAYYACLEEMGRASAAFAVAVSVTNISQGAIANYGTAEQHKSYLSKLTSGQWLGAFSLSEPQSGSDAGALQLKASVHGDGYRLNGNKLWCSNAAEADLFLVIARTDPDRSRGITAFLVSKTTPGFRIGKQEKKMGLLASSLAELVFEDAFIPAAQILGRVGQGFEVALSQLDGGRIAIGSIGVGIAIECVERAWQALRARERNHGVPFEDGAKQRLGDHFANVLAIRALISRAAAARDQRVISSELSASVKLLGSDLAMRVADEVMILVGETSSDRLAEFERYFRDAKALQIVEGTNQIQRVVLARQLERYLE